MKITKFVLFVMSFFILGAFSANAYSTTATVTVNVGMGGAITVPLSCDIPLNGINCSVNYVWNSFNTIDIFDSGLPVIIKKSGALLTQLQKGTSGSGTLVVPAGSLELSLYGNVKLSNGTLTTYTNNVEGPQKIDSKTISAVCTPGTYWINGKCAIMTGKITVTNPNSTCDVGSGKSCVINYSWVVTNPMSSGSSAVRTSNGTQIDNSPDRAEDASRGIKNYTLSTSKESISLYNNGKLLHTVTVYATGIVDGGWSDWSICDPSTKSQSRTCTNPTPSGGGADCRLIDSGSSSRSCVPLVSKIVIDAKNNGKLILDADKIPYNSKATLDWSEKPNGSENLYGYSGCLCSYKDSTIAGIGNSCGNVDGKSSYSTPSLKRNTTYTISCSGVSASKTIQVDKINAGYQEN